MPVAQITRQGLTAIAILVTILWGCLFAERYFKRSATLETYRALRQIRYLKFKRHIEPATGPAGRSAPLRRPAVG